MLRRSATPSVRRASPPRPGSAVSRAYSAEARIRELEEENRRLRGG